MSLFEMNVDLNDSYAPVYTDASKLAVVMLSYHIIRNIINGKPELLPEASLQAILYAILGVFIYHLIYTKIIKVHFTESK